MRHLPSLALCALASLLAAQSPQSPTFQHELGTAVPYLLVSGDFVRCATTPAAPTERLPAPSPNPNKLVATDGLGYVGWMHSNVGGDQIHFARSTDGGKSWSPDRTLFTSAAGTDINELRIVAEGHDVYILWRTNETETTLGLPSGSIASTWDFLIMASTDQGQTFSKPVLLNPNLAKAGSANIWGELLDASITRDPVSKNTRVHASFEWGTRSPAGEFPYYTAWELQNGSLVQIHSETEVTQGKGKEIDYVGITAQASIVVMSYRDDRSVSSAIGNRMWANWSIDGGKTWQANDLLLGKPGDLTMNNISNNSMAEFCYRNMAVDGANIYIMWKDRSHGQSTPPAVNNNERLILQYSNNLGFSWNWTVVSDYQSGLADIDEAAIVASGGRVAIAVVSDERGRHKGIAGIKGTLTNTPADAVTAMDNQGNANTNDAVQIILSDDAGKTFGRRFWLSQPPVDGNDPQSAALSGTLGAANLKGTNYKTCWNLSLANRHDVLQVCWEEEHYDGFPVFQGQDLMIATSTDFGSTWGPKPVPHDNTSNLTQKASPALGYTTDSTGALGGSVPHFDIDDPQVAILANGSAIAGFRQAKPHGSSDRPQVATKVLPLGTDTVGVSVTGGTQKLALDAGKKYAGMTYLVAGALNLGPGPHGFQLQLAYIPLTPDPYTDLTIANKNSTVFQSTFGKLDGEGMAAASIIAPNLNNPSLIGINLFHAFVVVDGNGQFVFASNTARLQLTK